jgi:hypothetical protein
MSRTFRYPHLIAAALLGFVIGGGAGIALMTEWPLVETSDECPDEKDARTTERFDGVGGYGLS